MSRARAGVAVLVAVVAVAGFFAGRMSVGERPQTPRADMAAPTPTATSAATPAPTPGTNVVEGDGTLAVGITEPNPNLIASTGETEFARWQPALTDGIRPTYYRLVIDWAALAAPDGSGFDVAQPNAGCMRSTPPCAPYAGLRAQLTAVKQAQEAHPGRFQLFVVFTATPAGLAAGPRGCERAETEPRSRPPRADSMEPYRAAIRAVYGEARRQGVEIAYVSPWNEPNHPFFISPQRRACDGASPSRAVGAYLRLVQAMTEELAALEEPGRLVLGETAAFTRRTANTTTVQELIRALPRRTVCAAAAYGQHSYLGGRDPIPAVARSLARFKCQRTPQIWVTETGAEVGRAGAPDACEALAKRLRRWYRDPRVTAAFQYTFREDDMFRTGLITTDLRRAQPVLGLWRAWGSRPTAAADPPRGGC